MRTVQNHENGNDESVDDRNDFGLCGREKTADLPPMMMTGTRSAHAAARIAAVSRASEKCG